MTATRPLLLASLALLALATGCPSRACRPDRFPPSHERKTPRETAEFFQYLLRHGCHEKAYEALSSGTRRQVTPTKWRWIGPWIDYPGTDRTIVDLVSEATIFHAAVHQGGRLATVWLEHRDFHDEVQEVLLVLEDGRWQIGLLESYQQGYFRDRRPPGARRDSPAKKGSDFVVPRALGG